VNKNPSDLDGATLRFHFDDGPMRGKEFDHTFREGKVEWGATGSGQRTTSDGELVRIGEACYVGSYMGGNGYTLTTALNLASGELVAFASNGKDWVRQTGTVKRVA
jgi:hypothetical protein